MPSRLCMLLIAAAVLVGSLNELTHAQALPPVNLGFTSFLDGGPPAGPGFYFQEYIQYWSADDLQNAAGNNTGLIDDLDVWISLNQFIYQSDQPILFGGKWGLDVIVPLISLDVDPGMPPIITDNTEGLGDILVGPFIQWDPVMGENGPIFMHRFEMQTVFPTGKYDDNEVLNPGNNHYSLNPYWAATLWVAPPWSITWRIHYLWNTENDAPNTTLFPGADDVQPGEAIHINFASSFELIPKKLHVGINGYYLEQITDSKVDGADSGYREEVLGLGPGGVWHFSADDHLFFNLYFESGAENRPEGIRLNIRWTHHF